MSRHTISCVFAVILCTARLAAAHGHGEHASPSGHNGGHFHPEIRPCQGRFDLRLEALELVREDPAERPLAIEQLVGSAGETVSDAEDLDQGFEPGARLVLGIRLGRCWRIEASGFWLDESDETDTESRAASLDTPFAVRGDVPGDLFLPTGFQGGFDFQGNDLIRTELDSRVFGAEAGLWRSWGESCLTGTVGGGLRFLELDEDLTYTADDSLANPSGDTFFTLANAIDNHLMGAQVGGGVRMQAFDLLSFGLDARAGLFANWMERDSSLVRGDGLVGIEGGGDDVGFATVLEVSGDARCEVTGRVSMVLGYRLMQVNGAALATENLQENLSDPEEYQTLGGDGSVFWHGLFFGVEIRF